MNLSPVQTWISPLVVGALMALTHAQTPPDTLNIGIHAKAAFSVQQAAVGDTLEYVLAVEWVDARIPVVVLAPDSMSTPGFRVAGQNASHKKSARGDSVWNRTEFTYRLVPTVPGQSKVASLKLRYMTGLSNHEEALYVPAAFLEIVPAAIPLWSSWWFRLLGSLLLVGALMGGIWQGLGTLKKRRQLNKPGQGKDFGSAVKALRGRWNAADSKKWIADAEAVCLDYLRERLNVSSRENGRVEILLEQFLKTQALPPAEIEGWTRLRDLFHHARYAGGQKEPHELQESHRTLKTCLHIQGEES